MKLRKNTMEMKLNLSLIYIAIVIGAISPTIRGQTVFNSPSDNITDNESSRFFGIDYEKDTFTMDGKPFRYIAGSVHYFRSPHQDWRRLLRSVRAAGLNAVTTYVEWSFHEPERRQYLWTGDRDLEKFIKLAEEENLYVILRPGPYICAERDLGGFPYWLLSEYPNIRLRTSDSDYKSEVTIWYQELMSRMQPLFYGNGGPIIMVQVENEYGSYKACDRSYMSWLADLTYQWTKGAAVLFTTDGNSANLLRCGSTPGVYPTIDFGSGSNVTQSWEQQRMFAPHGPLVNSEYYPGWLTHWGESMAKVDARNVIKTLGLMLDSGANVNFYMFHGGTNFEYTAGANYGDSYTPDITSYDYDAPLTEAGDITSKYILIRNKLLEYVEDPGLALPQPRPKVSLGPVQLRACVRLFSEDGRSLLGTEPQAFAKPPSYEKLRQMGGLVLYETMLPVKRSDPSALTVPILRDRALVYINEGLAGVLSRSKKLFTMPLLEALGDNLQILVENQGRINYGSYIHDFKGILGNVTLNSRNLFNWKVTGFPLPGNLPEAVVQSSIDMEKWSYHGLLRHGPVLYAGSFTLPDEEQLTTYLDVSGWSKGFAWVNGYHLGRYWPSEGPQGSLYVPAAWLKPSPEDNTVVVLEMQRAPKNLSIKFIEHPINQ